MARVLHSVQGVEERFVRGKRRHRGSREERVVREDVTGGNHEGTCSSSSVVSLLFLLSIPFFSSSEGIISRWGLDIIPNFAHHLCRDDDV